VARTGACVVNQFGIATTSSGLTCAQPSTTNITEGTNLYYTEARVLATRQMQFTNTSATTCSISNLTAIKMAGLGMTYTTKAANTSKNIFITMNWQLVTPANLNSISRYTLVYGTDAAPACNAVPSGTLVGNQYKVQQDASVAASMPMSETVVITGLTANTAYWFDLQVNTTNAGTWVYSAPQISVIEQ
jgi:hypothetical protein